MALAVLAFSGISLLAVHLLYLPDAPRTDVRPPVAPAASMPAPIVPLLATPAPAPGPAPDEGFTHPPSLGVVEPVPSVAEWDRRLSECIERKAQGTGRDDRERAREARRLRRLPVTTECERELAREMRARTGPPQRGRS